MAASSSYSKDPSTANSSNSTTNNADTTVVLSTPNLFRPIPHDESSLAHSQVTPHITPSLPSSPITPSQPNHHLADTLATSTATKTTHPIPIPTITLPRSDPDRIPTPVSARGERKGHLFPYSRTPSPNPAAPAYSPSRLSQSSPEPDDYSSAGGRERRRSSSSSSRSLRIFNMHSEQYSGRYIPTSPLSPKLPSGSQPQQPNQRSGHARQTSRSLQMSLPRYHPANFQHQGSAATPTSTVQSPAITINRVSQPMQPMQIESPRMMREKQRELIDGFRLSSILAASPASQKPGSPRLDPLGSPKGAVTPFSLEEATDYFSVAATGKRSPAVSPGGKSHRSSRSDVSSGKDDGHRKSHRKVDAYQ